jgi:hypothetical protein
MRVPPNVNNNEVKFIHLRYSDTDGEYSSHGGATVAFRPSNTDLGKVEVALSRCNPKDHFCKKIGRAIAVGALNYNNMWLLDKKPTNKEQYETIINFVYRKINEANPATKVMN